MRTHSSTTHARERARGRKVEKIGQNGIERGVKGRGDEWRRKRRRVGKNEESRRERRKKMKRGERQRN